MFNIDTENKNNQTNFGAEELTNSIESFRSRLEHAEDRISELKTICI